MTSVAVSRSHAQPSAPKLRRLSATLRRFGEDVVHWAEDLDGAYGRALTEFGEDNRGAGAWLNRLADRIETRSLDQRELDRIIERAVNAKAIAHLVRVRVDVTVRDGTDVEPAQVDAVRELCQTAPGVVFHLLVRGEQNEQLLAELDEVRRRGLLIGVLADGDNATSRPAKEQAALMAELRELEERGLIAIGRDGAGELRCRPTNDRGCS